MILIAIGAFMDASSTNLTRPSNFYLSQAIIGFASLLFLAQAMVIGIARTLLAGGKHFISYVVLFALSQSVGGLIGYGLPQHVPGRSREIPFRTSWCSRSY